ncbi:ATP-grasp domain-containing protein [Kutzneria buriramensis]|uniref:ATP-grasp domain-containing protein n=1 Tax=Kutzneria buriramensis TaxID=1045776 RepID=A0A3E0HNY4_9PSEU|nr:ATP-grasp domain-containing protein [Kutzneria buriramensis]REH48149.1 hypothetical protein BCF44_1057 [Kutzneria buriramensis]
MTLIVPADPLRPRRADEHFAAEAAAARAAGVEVVLVDHDRLARGEAVPLPPLSDAVYRGWMLRSSDYALLSGMRASASLYRQAHEFPGWYSALAAVTPHSVWTSDFSRAAFGRARSESGSGPAVLRDYTKSMKHYWSEAAFIPDLADADAAWAVASRFVELRDESLTGGFVLRRFEDFVAPELRTWWVDGECRIVGPHPDLPADTVVPQPDLTAIEPLVAALGLPFVTVDVVQRADGVWRVVELGDGQVSDRPAAVSPESLIGMLFSQG